MTHRLMIKARNATHGKKLQRTDTGFESRAVDEVKTSEPKRSRK